MRNARSLGGQLRWLAGAAVIFLAIGLWGCSRTPEQKAARFLASGKAQIAKKDYARAILDLKNAARLQPKHAEPYYQAGLAYLGMGDYRMAYSSLLRATEFD